MLGGGLSDGTICVWNPARILETETDASKASLLCRLNKHQGAVRGLQFNPFSAKLLASGAGDGEVCIWDLSNPSQPSLYPAMKSGTGDTQNQITCLEWNPKVQHIMATGTSSGSVIVWDLKKQRPVISFTDSSRRRRCSSIAWNPNIATQVMVASDEDNALQLWDLRNAASPLAELQGHTKGVLSLDWSPHDASMLLSSGKDNRIILWDLPSGKPNKNMYAGPNWKFEVQWSNSKQPGVFAGATFEGLVSLHSVSACPDESVTPGDSATLSTLSSGTPPSWLEKPVAGASFGFGGKMLKITNTKRQLPTGEIVTTASAEVEQLQIQGTVSKISPEFENVIRSADRDSLRTLCETRANAAQDPQEAETWRFLQTHFEADSKHHLLSRLGFESVLPNEVAVSNENAEYRVTEQAVDAAQESLGGMSIQQQQVADSNGQLAQQVMNYPNDDGSGFFSQSPVDGDSFFDNLSSPVQQKPASNMPVHAAKDAILSPPVLSPKAPEIVDGTPGEAESTIQKLLFVGNYKSAVETCLGAKRFSDALIIASMIGGDVWEKARKDVMLSQPRPYMRVIHATLDGDWNAYVKSRPSHAWQETLATLLTSAPYDRFEELVGLLESKLEASGALHPSILCSICSGNVENAVRLWSESIGQDASAQAREGMMEKAVVLGLGVDKTGSSSALGDLLARQAEELASSGQLAAAYDLLCLVPGETSAKASDLRDRLAQGGALDNPTMPSEPQTLPQQTWESSTQHIPSNFGQEQYSQPPSYAAPQTYKPSPPATPYSTGSGGQQYLAGPPPTMQGPTHAGFVSQQPQVFTPAQPQQAVPPTTFSSSALAPPPTVSSFQPGATVPPTGPPVASAPMAPQPQYHGTGNLGVSSPGPASPGAMHAPPTVYQHTAQAQVQPVNAVKTYESQQHQQDYMPSAPPPQVFQPTVTEPSFQGPLSVGAGVSQYQAGPQPPVPKSQPSTPAPPPGPPSNISLMSADTSKVSPQLGSVVNSLKALYQGAEAVVGAQPARRRELDDASRKLGGLLWKMNAGMVSESVGEKLQQLCTALDAFDYASAAHVQVMLTTSDWDECSSWLTALKRLVKLRQMG